MNRLAVASLAVAAVLGTTGGVTLAVARTGDDGGSGRDGATPTARADGSPSASDGGSGGDDPAATGKDAAGLLYYADGAIHDGDRDVAVPTTVGDVLALQRVQGGWLLVESTEHASGDPTSVGTYVTEDGDDWRIGEWRGAWDLTVERDRVVYGNGVSWKVADFAERKATPLDIVDGLGEELDFMARPEIVSGIAITAKGVLTGWEEKGENRIVETETDHWTHELLALPSAVDVPLTSADGRFAVAVQPNPETTPTNPVGSCLTGGPLDDVEGWWSECQIGPASSDPFSRDGTQVLTGVSVNDGPSPSELTVRDAATGKVQHELDPGGYYLEGVEWADEDGVVIALTSDDGTSALTIRRCVVRTGRCTAVTKVEGDVVLGSST